MERYDIYVFNLPTNKSLLRAIPEQAIITYARKYKNPKKIAALKNFYFKTPEAAEDKKACFMNIKQQFAYQHRLMITVRTFFSFIWVLFPIALIAIAFVVDHHFSDTVIDIFIPSLSAISLIASSVISFNEHLRRLNNAINVINEMMPNGKKDAATVPLQSPLVLRSLQDTLFSHRQKNFICPGFLERRFKRMLANEEELRNTEIMLNNPVKTKKSNGSVRTKNVTSEKAPATKPQAKAEAAKSNGKSSVESPSSMTVSRTPQGTATQIATSQSVQAKIAQQTQTKNTSTEQGPQQATQAKSAQIASKTVKQVKTAKTTNGTVSKPSTTNEKSQTKKPARPATSAKNSNSASKNG